MRRNKHHFILMLSLNKSFKFNLTKQGRAIKGNIAKKNMDNGGNDIIMQWDPFGGTIPIHINHIIWLMWIEFKANCTLFQN